MVRTLAPVERVQIDRAAGWLAGVVRAEPSLSDERVLDRQIARMEEKAARLKREQEWGLGYLHGLEASCQYHACLPTQPPAASPPPRQPTT